jgi:SAM-dependent methyltransferase
MRNTGEVDGTGAEPVRPDDFDAASFFDSYYRATSSNAPSDAETIGTVTEPEARFHYNAIENSIIRALARRQPFDRAAPAVWRFAQRRRRWSVLDVGSGAGHWIEFYRSTYHASRVLGIELVPRLVEHLRARFASDPAVSVSHHDIGESPLDSAPFDVVNAIGVMFHIVDDARWKQAICHLARALEPGGLMLIGGDFGATTRDVQFHRKDNFGTWAQHDAGDEPPVRVNKRVRSLAAWAAAAAESGLEIVDLVRSDCSPAIRTPENDLLVLMRSGAQRG